MIFLFCLGDVILIINCIYGCLEDENEGRYYKYFCLFYEILRIIN